MKFDLAKRANPESETFVRICTESPLSDDLLAKLKKRKSDAGSSSCIDLTTPPMKKQKTTPYGSCSSTFGDSSLFNDALALTESNTPNLPEKETQKTDLKSRMQRLEAIKIADESDGDMEDDDLDDESSYSPIIQRSSARPVEARNKSPEKPPPIHSSPPSVFARVKVKTVPQRSPKKKTSRSEQDSSSLDVSKLVAQSNLFKKERTNRGNRPFNRLGGSSKANPIKLKSSTRKPNIRDFFANTKMT